MAEGNKKDWTIIKAGAQVTNVPSVSSSFEADDEFKGMYQASSKTSIIEPPYNQKILYRLAQENNTLPACVEAMVANIDGTGYTFKKKGESQSDEDKDPTIVSLKELFDQFGVKQSFTKMRKELRRNTEYTGNGYLEIVSTINGDFAFGRVLDSKVTRLLRLDGAVPVTYEVNRNGKKSSITAYVRERRFAMSIGGNRYQYFKEFGASRDLNRDTGEWGTPESPVPANLRASEVLHFKAAPDAHTPYGVPRWISQLTSVLGARKAEEFNVEFFDNGGVPPVIIFLQGGNLSAQTRRELEAIGYGGAMKKNRVMVVELEPGGGTIDKPVESKAVVERFGADRQNDSMFANYDKDCSAKVKRSFRISGLFLGETESFNFATSYTAYMVTEQQVFKPERDDFDEVISVQILPRLGFEDYEMISNPLTLKNSDLIGLGIDKAQAIGGVNKEALIEAVNLMSGTEFSYSEEDDAVKRKAEAEIEATKKPLTDQVQTQVSGKPSPAMTAGKPNLTVVKSDGLTATSGVFELAFELRDALLKGDKEELSSLMPIVSALPEADQEVLRTAMAKMVYITDDPEDLGLQELAGCGATVLAREALFKEDHQCGHEH